MSSKSVPELEHWLSLGRKCRRSHGLWDRWPLGSHLADTLRDFDNVTVVNQDILKVDSTSTSQSLKTQTFPDQGSANLPYYITTPILMHLIESKIPFQEFVVMMQKEVADRISAEPNTKAYGSLSIAVQYYMTAKVAFIVPRTVFVPAPNVDSAILKMVRREEPAVTVKDEDFFFSVSKASFVQPPQNALEQLDQSLWQDWRNQSQTGSRDPSCRPATFCTRRSP